MQKKLILSLLLCISVFATWRLNSYVRHIREVLVAQHPTHERTFSLCNQLGLLLVCTRGDGRWFLEFAIVFGKQFPQTPYPQGSLTVYPSKWPMNIELRGE
jgi:hypothetical protein